MTDAELQTIKTYYTPSPESGQLFSGAYRSDVLDLIAEIEFLKLLIHDLREEKGISSPDALTVEQVRQQVEKLTNAGNEGAEESAHIEEDRLHQDVLRAIAENRCESPALCAKEALRTLEIKFSRWYA